VDDILARGKLPIVVGGTGLYIDSLIAGRTFADGTADTALRQELSERYDEIGGDGLLGELRKFDPERAAKLHPADKKRIVRAMEVYILTGRTITQHDAETRAVPPRYDAAKIALTFAARQDLYARIDRRVDAMMQQGLLDEVRQKLAKIDVRSVSMSQESIAEAMMGKKQWWTPFPKVRYTERPDAATACVMEGDIVVLVDNSPAAMILPTHFFDFVQEANDFYFPPLIGTYLRILRIVVFLLTMFITPVWFLLVKDPSRTQAGLEFLAIDSDYSVPLLVQLLLAEFIVDLLKLASLNTPDVFSNSFSMLGALVLGDFAVQAHWLVPEVLAYMAFVAIANFAQPSYELGYAFKLLRLMLLLFVGALDWIGLVLGCIVIVVLLATTKPIVGKGYLYPLCPLDKKALLALLVRKPISRDNT